VEQKILAALVQERINYERIKDYLEGVITGPESKLVLNEIDEYYNSDPGAERVDTEVLIARFERRLPNPKHAAACTAIVKSLPDVSGANIVREVLEAKAFSIGLELAQSLVGGAGGKDARVLAERYLEALGRNSLEEDKEELTNVSVQSLVSERLDQSRLIQLAPKALNDRLDGGVLPGHHVLVFAPTEMGKTAFVVNAVAHFLRSGHKILYVGNEDPYQEIILRLVYRLSGLSKYTIKGREEEAQALIDKAGWNNLVYADLAPGTFPRIERLVRKHRPKILVLDQLSNINVSTSKSDSKTGSLEQAAKEARRLGKQYECVVLSVTQAADSATGRAVLGRGDVYNSNVGIPGQLDLQLGIGADEGMEARGLREISIVKNKISGNHDHFTVQFDPIYSKYS